MSNKYRSPDKPDLEWSSANTICSDVTDKSWSLTAWYAILVVQHIRDNCEKLKFNEEIWGRWDKKEVHYLVSNSDLEDARFNFRNVSQDALDIGSAVHDSIEHYLKTGKEPKIEHEQVLAGFVAFLEWKDENKLFPLALEETVYGEFYGGRTDFRGMYKEQEYIIDWKTSRDFYPEMRYQTAAYRSCCPDVVGNAVLRLDKETGLPEFSDYSKSYEHDLEVFKTMVKLYYLRHPQLAKKAGWKGV